MIDNIDWQPKEEPTAKFDSLELGSCGSSGMGEVKSWWSTNAVLNINDPILMRAIRKRVKELMELVEPYGSTEFHMGNGKED